MQNTDLSEYLTKATEYLSKKDFNNALKEYKKVLKTSENNTEALKGAGLCSYNLNDFISSEKYFRTAISVDENDATSLYYIASLAILNEKFVDAVNYSTKVIELRPDFFDGYKILFSIYLKLQRFNDILDLYKKFVDNNVKSEDDSIFIIIATVYMMRKNYNDAISLFKEALKIVPKKAQTLNNLGVCYMSLKDFDGAINIFKQSLEIEPDNSLTYTDLGTCLQLKGNLLQALDIFKKALELEPDNFLNLLNVANLSNLLRKYDIAIDAYEKMLNINPNLKEIQSSLIGAYVKNGQADKAINLIDIALKNTPRNVPLLFRKAKIYTDLGDFNAATKVYEQIVSFKKNSPAVYHAYAVLYSKMKDFDKALKYLNKALALDETNAAVHKDLGVIYLMRNQVDYAKDEFDKALSFGDTDNDILKECADFYYSISDFNRADELYRKSLVLENNPYTSLSLGRNLIAQNKLDEAFAVLEPLLMNLPDDAELLYNIARISYAKNDFDMASRLLRKAYYQVPTIEIANLLALCLKNLGDFKGAANIFDKIIKEYPLNEFVYDDLIECYEKLDDKEAQINTYKLALEKLLYSEEKTLKLAQLLIDTGKKEEAKTILDKANFEHPSEKLSELTNAIK